MTGTQLELLREIAEGLDTFAPEGSSVEEYRAFQPVADALARLEGQGYFGRCELRHEIRTRMRHIERVVVRKGLTTLGKKFLQKG